MQLQLRVLLVGLAMLGFAVSSRRENKRFRVAKTQCLGKGYAKKKMAVQK